MKKVLILLLLSIVACGGSSEETVVEDTTTTSIEDTTTTTVQDTTTTTIPLAPTSDINYIELYNSKLGTELCSDAKELDTTSEECLRQYKENLNYLITLQNEIGDFASDLIAYYEIYPELINQEYEDYINFIENEYSQIFLKFSDVENKYIERFGGVPILESLNFSSGLTVGCPAEINFSYTTNLKNANLVFKNNTNESVIINFKNGEVSQSQEMINTGGNFIFTEGVLTNYLGEEYKISLDKSFYVSFPIFRFVKIEFDRNEVNYGEDFKLIVQYENNPRYELLGESSRFYKITVKLGSNSGNYEEYLDWAGGEDAIEYQIGGFVDTSTKTISIDGKFQERTDYETEFNYITPNIPANPYYIQKIEYWIALPGGFNITRLYGTYDSEIGTYQDIENDCKILQGGILQAPIFSNNYISFQK